MFNRKSILALTVLGIFTVANIAMADYGTKKHQGKWDKNHPRQAEVNGRLQNQHNRVKAGEANGTLTKQQGNQVKREDNHIYNEEQNMKARNGSDSLTAGQQAKINRQENGVSNQINRDEAKNANANAAGAGAPPAPAPGN